MEELIQTFHIDWKLLIAQLINFAIVLFVLWKFAIKPLSKTMDKRTNDIEKSIDDAKKIEENLQCEIFDVCLEEAQKKKHKIIVVDTFKRFDKKKLVKEIKRKI